MLILIILPFKTNSRHLNLNINIIYNFLLCNFYLITQCKLFNRLNCFLKTYFYTTHLIMFNDIFLPFINGNY